MKQLRWKDCLGGVGLALVLSACGLEKAAEKFVNQLPEPLKPAELLFSGPENHDFMVVPVGSTREVTFTVTNPGEVDAAFVIPEPLSGPFSFKDGEFPGTGGNCTDKVGAGKACTIVVAIVPIAVGSIASSLTVRFFSGAVSKSSTKGLLATAVAPALLTVSDGPTYDYGPVAVGATLDKTFTVSNSGGYAAASVSGASFSGPFSFLGGAFPGTGGTCAATLDVSASCTVVVRFSPGSVQAFSSTLSLAYFDGAVSTSATRPVQGTGIAPALLTISDGATYNYGNVVVGLNASKTFTVTNTGTASATSMSGSALSSPYSYVGGTYPGTGGTCSTSLAASATCTVVVRFTPTVSGLASATLTVNYQNGVTTTTATRPMQGTGQTPASLSISNGPTFNYGTVAVGGTSNQTFTVTNSGQVSATSLSGTALSAPFGYLGGSYPGTGGSCGASLAAAGTCTVVVAFSPVAVTASSDTLTVNYSDGVGATSATRAIQGTGVSPANLTITDNPVYDFGSILVTSSAEHTFTISNSGTFSATSISATALSSPFSFKGGSYPGTGGNCGASLAGFGVCTIVVVFSPASAGPFSATLSLSYSNGVTTTSSTRAIQGLGTAPATLSISDGPTFDYGSVAVGGSSDKSFTISNTGSVTALVISAQALSLGFDFLGGSYPGTGGTCTNNLAASASCSIVVRFAPLGLGLASSALTLDYNNGVSSVSASRALQGTGASAANLTISDGPTFDFGTQAVGSNTDQTFTVTNSGSVSSTSMSGAVLSPPFAYLGGSYPGTGGTCGSSLAAAATCTVVVRYSPSGAGLDTGTLTLNYNTGVSATTATRAMQGTGATPATLTISDGPTYSYGNVFTTQSSSKVFTVTHSGGVAATSMSGAALSAPYAYTGGSYPGTGGTCGASLAVSGTCTISVTFSPTVSGLQSATLTVNYNTGASATTATRAMQGTGQVPATFTISDGATYDFGSVATGGTLNKTFTVTNSGDVSGTAVSGAALSAPFTFLGGSYPGTGGTCGATLAAAGTCTIVVRYSPVATVTSSATLTVNYNTGLAATTATRPMQGTGATPATLTISDGPTYSYGTQATGSSTDKTFTVTHSGGVSATSVSGAALSTPYSYAGGSYPGTGGTCGASLAVSATCTIVVRYSPVANGLTSATLTVNYNTGVSATTATRAMQGTGATPATLTISDGPTYNYGTVYTVQTPSKVFTVTHSGGVAATSMSGAALSAPYAYTGGSYPGTGGTCAASLAVSATCTISVTFSPSSAGLQSATLTVNYNTGASATTATRAMQGTGQVAALLSISDGPTFDFGPIATTGTSNKTFTVSNSGTVSATAMSGSALSAPYTFLGGSYPGTGGTCGATLAAAGTCTIVVRFAPVSTGLFSATLTVNYNNGIGPITATRPMQGTGATAALLTISDGATYNYGTQAIGGNTDKTFTVTNSGGATATAISGAALSAPFAFLGGSFPGTGGTCGASLSGSSTCTVIVRYSPSSAVLSSGTLQVNYNTGVSSTNTTRPIQGTGASPAFLTVSDGPTYDFGSISVGGFSEKTFTVTNSGGVSSTSMSGTALAAPFLYKGGTYPGTGGTCSTTLAAASSCTVIVRFAPSVVGSYSASISIDYSTGATTTTATRALIGSGLSRGGLDSVSLIPSQGPSYGRNVLRLQGKNLPTDLKIFLGQKECVRQEMNFSDHVECTVPPASVGRVSVSLESAFATMVATQEYEYLPSRWVPVLNRDLPYDRLQNWTEEGSIEGKNKLEFSGTKFSFILGKKHESASLLAYQLESGSQKLRSSWLNEVSYENAWSPNWIQYRDVAYLSWLESDGRQTHLRSQVVWPGIEKITGFRVATEGALDVGGPIDVKTFLFQDSLYSVLVSRGGNPEIQGVWKAE